MNFGTAIWPSMAGPCDETPPEKFSNVTGTSHIHTGFRMRAPKVTRGQKSWQIDPRDPITWKDAEINPSAAPVLTKDGLDLIRQDKITVFERRTDAKIKDRLVQDRVTKGLMAYEEDLDDRRAKLRQQLYREEKDLTTEIVSTAQKLAVNRIAEVEARLENAKRQKEKERQKLVEKMRARQLLATQQEVKEVLSKRKTRHAKDSNLAQMMDNEARKNAETEEEMFWHKMMLKDMEAKAEREIEEVKRRAASDLECAETLKKQIAGKAALEEEERQCREEQREYLERLKENFRREETCKLEREREARARLRKDLEHQLELVKKRLAEREAEEIETDRMFDVLTKEEIAKEHGKAAIAAAALRKEIVAYTKYIQEVRESVAQREAEVDAAVQRDAKELDEQLVQRKKREKEARARILERVLAGRAEQVRLKEENANRERQHLDLERKTLEKEREIEAELIERNRRLRSEAMLRYRRELADQMDQEETRRRREREEEDTFHRNNMRLEEENRKFASELLNTPVADEGRPHVFRARLEEYVAMLRNEEPPERPSS